MLILSAIQGLPSFKLVDLIDVLVVAFLFYYLYKLLKGTNAVNIILGFMLVFVAWKLVRLLNMQLLSDIFDQFLSVGVIAIIIIFQTEIRQFLIRLGSNAWERRWSKWLFAGSKKQVPVLDVTSIVQACGHMSQSLTGALIVFCKSNPLDQIAQTGDCFSSEINSRLLETIFFKNTPLHDGALIIENGRIKAARCILPVSKNPDIPPSMGLRHRSAVGVTEQTDAIAVIVSEQTGKISVAKNGTVRQGLSTNELQQYLNKEFNE